MIPIKALSRFILNTALNISLNLSKNEAIKNAKRSSARDQFNNVKVLIAEEVAKAYSNQIKSLSEGYIKVIQDSVLEIEFSRDDSGKITLLADGALRKLEVYLKEQNPEGPIIQYLQERYKEENIKIITGKLYAGHYVARAGQGVYKIYNRMSYAPFVDKNKPWLSSEKTTQGIGDLIAEKADQLFQEAFNIDISETEVRSI